MKKGFMLFFTALVLITGLAVADGVGLSAGLELAMPDVNNAEEFPLEITAIIEYDNSFDDLDIWAELRTPMGIAGDAKAGDETSIGIELEFDAGYNLALSDVSTLSLGLWGQMNIPVSPSGGDLTLPLMPWISFNQEMDFGDIYVTLGVPLGFINTDFDELEMGLDLTLGWAGNFGLGIELTTHFMFAPADYVDTYDGLTLLLSYETGPVYAELEMALPNDFDFGIGIDLLVEYDFDPWTFYFSVGFDGVGSDYDIGISPALGVKFSF